MFSSLIPCLWSVSTSNTMFCDLFSNLIPCLCLCPFQNPCAGCRTSPWIRQPPSSPAEHAVSVLQDGERCWTGLTSVQLAACEEHRIENSDCNKFCCNEFTLVINVTLQCTKSNILSDGAGSPKSCHVCNLSYVLYCSHPLYC